MLRDSCYFLLTIANMFQPNLGSLVFGFAVAIIMLLVALMIIVITVIYLHLLKQLDTIIVVSLGNSISAMHETVAKLLHFIAIPLLV
jgi:hypothetical protein